MHPLRAIFIIVQGAKNPSNREDVVNNPQIYRCSENHGLQSTGSRHVYFSSQSRFHTPVMSVYQCRQCKVTKLSCLPPLGAAFETAFRLFSSACSAPLEDSADVVIFSRQLRQQRGTFLSKNKREADGLSCERPDSEPGRDHM